MTGDSFPCKSLFFAASVSKPSSPLTGTVVGEIGVTERCGDVLAEQQWDDSSSCRLSLTNSFVTGSLSMSIISVVLIFEAGTVEFPLLGSMATDMAGIWAASMGVVALGCVAGMGTQPDVAGDWTASMGVVTVLALSFPSIPF